MRKNNDRKFISDTKSMVSWGSKLEHLMQRSKGGYTSRVACLLGLVALSGCSDPVVRSLPQQAAVRLSENQAGLVAPQGVTIGPFYQRVDIKRHYTSTWNCNNKHAQVEVYTLVFEEPKDNFVQGIQEYQSDCEAPGKNRVAGRYNANSLYLYFPDEPTTKVMVYRINPKSGTLIMQGSIKYADDVLTFTKAAENPRQITNEIIAYNGSPATMFTSSEYYQLNKDPRPSAVSFRMQTSAEENEDAAAGAAIIAQREAEDAAEQAADNTASGLVAMLGAAAQNYAAARGAAPSARTISSLMATPAVLAVPRTATAEKPAATRVQTAVDVPKYTPQVVVLPQADLVCPAGQTWHDASGVGAKGGTCYGGSHTLGAPGLNAGSNRLASASGSTLPPQPVTGSGGSSQTVASSQANVAKQPAQIKWGAVQLEALAICRKSDINGKWWCDGPLQETMADQDTVEAALSTVSCKIPTRAAGGTLKSGKQADVYRCGYGLNAGDRNIAKIYALVTAQRSYMCPEYHDYDCKTFYDGQNKH